MQPINLFKGAQKIGSLILNPISVTPELRNFLPSDFFRCNFVFAPYSSLRTHFYNDLGLTGLQRPRLAVIKLQNEPRRNFTGLWFYRNDRLNNSLFLSPSLCTKRSILFGRGNSTQAVYKRRQAKIWRPGSGTK